MKNLTAFTVYGTATGINKNIQLDEISIIANPRTMRALENSRINAADEMAQYGLEHLHLRVKGGGPL
ncbi:Imm32 family immunity protein [Pseudomonas sp. NPDC078416]|uniref:Imm32 family immunity protein n=1 Tax=Pseudomonas sp. NPDC078416 TaxID=3390637 RepID=UPI003D079427